MKNRFAVNLLCFGTRAPSKSPALAHGRATERAEAQVSSRASARAGPQRSDLWNFDGTLVSGLPLFFPPFDKWLTRRSGSRYKCEPDRHSPRTSIRRANCQFRQCRVFQGTWTGLASIPL